MATHALSRIIAASTLVSLALSSPLFGQIMALTGGDGVLNAPYQGTAAALRAVHAGVGSGETMNFVEPQGLGSGTARIGTDVRIWCTDGVWDRSLLRLYRGMDASGGEINLTGHYSQATAITVALASLDPGQVLRLSAKAIGSKVLSPQTVHVKIGYTAGDCSNQFPIAVTRDRDLVIAPFSGSFSDVPDEASAYIHGTPILSVSSGAASLAVPVGRTAEMIGETFEFRTDQLGSSCTLNGPANLMKSIDAALPGAAESVFLGHAYQFWIEANPGHAYKTTDRYGTPDLPPFSVPGSMRVG